MNRFCPEMQDRIVDYLLGALEGPEAAAVQEHLAHCAGCRQYLQDLSRQGDALGGLGKRMTADTAARRDQVIQALETVAPEARIAPMIGRFMRVAAAA
ncbi:MAG: anti-sigma factor family protein, partial [Solirubrobacterales bacterium]